MEIINKERQYKALDARYGIKERNIDTFFRSLRRYEVKISRMNAWACERENFEWPENFDETIAKKLAAKFECPQLFLEEFYLNGDPRGYALKLNIPNNEYSIYRDLGGYGILAPANMQYVRR